MSVEAPVLYINQLNTSFPEGAADKQTADDHLKLIKSSVKATFPALSAAVTASHTELSLLVGVTSQLSTRLDAVSNSVSVQISRVDSLSVVVAGVSKLNFLARVSFSVTTATTIIGGIPAGAKRITIAALSAQFSSVVQVYLGTSVSVFTQASSVGWSLGPTSNLAILQGSGPGSYSGNAIMTLTRAAAGSNLWFGETILSNGDTSGADRGQKTAGFFSLNAELTRIQLVSFAMFPTSAFAVFYE